MHCHLFNIRDADSTSFLRDRVLQEEVEKYTGVRVSPGNSSEVMGIGNTFFNRMYQVWVNPFLQNVRDTVNIHTHTLEAETKFLSNLGSKTSAANFCREAAARQRALVLSDDVHGQLPLIGSGRITGFLSNRVRNAAYMMSAWPDVDLFMPAMVDFYEGTEGVERDHDGQSHGARFDDPSRKPSRNPSRTRRETDHDGGSASSIADQIEFYKQLNIATQGRFLPMVSYSPVRQYRHELYQKPGPSPLELVHDAICHKGFVGVKVHPSSGFDPLNNAKFGCGVGEGYQPLHEDTQMGHPNKDEASGHDKAMRMLFRLCIDLDVPILTHGGDGIPAHAECMQPDNGNPLDWTGSSEHWIRAIERERPYGDLRVCLAHFASGFKQHKPFGSKLKAKEPFDVRYEGDKDTGRASNAAKLVPSDWLERAVKDIRDNPRSGIWLDLSDMYEVIYSEATLDQKTDPRLHDDRSLSNAFRDYMCTLAQKSEQLDGVLDKVMYGTDWHMPKVSSIGSRYLDLMESVLPTDYRNKIMGRNAVRFFGIGEGARNRERLETFYREHNVELQDVRWRSRVDALKS